MKQLENKKLFDEQRDVWRLGAAIGIAQNEVYENEKKETFQNINTLDTDQVFAAIMLGLYPDMNPEERLKKLISHAEWGIREINRKVKIDTLDFSTLGLSESINVEGSKDENPEDDKQLELEDLINKGESLTLEFKSSLRWDTNNDKLLDEFSYACLKTIAGFSNSREGGTLLIGVDPDGKIVGLEKDYATLKLSNKDGFEQYLVSKVSDNIGINCATDITIEFLTYTGKEVCKVNVLPGLQPVYLTQNGKQIFYLKVGNATKSLNIEDALKYCAKRFKL